MSISGSIRKVLIDGLLFNVTADANFAKTPKTTKEAMPHTGGNMVKRTLAHGNVEGVKLSCTPSEYVALEEIAEGLKIVPFSYTMANGDTFRSQGEINLDNYESETNTVEVTMIPSNRQWELFAA